MFRGTWAVLDTRTKQYKESYKTKDEAMKSVNALNFRDGNFWAVVPLTDARLNALRERYKK